MMELYGKEGSDALENCARELGVTLDPCQDPALLLRRYIIALLEDIRKLVILRQLRKGNVILSIAADLSSAAGPRPDPEKMEAIRKRFNNEIESDDGWPVDPVAYALKSIYCALTFQDKSSRWLAEAAIKINGLFIYDDGMNRRSRAMAKKQLELVIARSG